MGCCSHSLDWLAPEGLNAAFRHRELGGFGLFDCLANTLFRRFLTLQEIRLQSENNLAESHHFSQK